LPTIICQRLFANETSTAVVMPFRRLRYFNPLLRHNAENIGVLG